jgi:trehalose-6-phosphate synthase
MSVRDELTARVESRKSSDSRMAPSQVTLGDHTTQLVVAPIGVDYDRIQKVANDPSLRVESFRLARELRLDEDGLDIIGLGVDRLDYTKGIPERLEAIDRLLTMRSDLRDRFAFVQVGVPSRSTIDSYAEIERQIDEKVAEINTRHGRSAAHGPIRYHKSALRIRKLVALYRLADFCVVSSLHDGMNLVAKEFVAARNDLDGVLVLSEMTGAAQELKEAVIINPYHVEGFAGALERAIAMKPAERVARMRSLRRVVAGHDIFVWASDILESLEQTENVGT